MYKKLLMLAILVSVSPAWAGTTYYIGSGAFGTDLTSGGLIPSALTDFTSATGLPGSPVSLLGVTFLTGAGFSATTPDSNSVNLTAIKQDNSGTMTVSFAAPVYAVLLNLTLVNTASTMWQINSGDGGPFFLEFGKTFAVGVITTDATHSFTLSQVFGGNQLKITDMLVGTMAVADAPEPSSLMLLGGSLLGLATMARWKKRQGDRRPESEQ